MDFVDALKQGSLTDIRKCPKADLHNHFVLGGSRSYLKEHSGRDIRPIMKPLHSMDEMHAWNAQNIGDYFNSPEGRSMLIKATFTQAKEDGVTVLEIGEDVRRAVECLELDEVQHGIAAAEDPSVIRFLSDNHIRLNITPSSNYLLGRVKDLKSHPIAELYRNGVDVTINSDDVLIFDSDVSKEYLRMYQSGCLTAEELDDIRKNGLREV